MNGLKKIFRRLRTLLWTSLTLLTVLAAVIVGIGKLLIHAFGEHVRQSGGGGMHIVTGAQMRNAGFYRQCGFRDIACTQWNGRQLLLLGKNV